MGAWGGSGSSVARLASRIAAVPVLRRTVHQKFGAVLREPDRPLEFQSDFLELRDRSVIVRGGDRHDAPQMQLPPAVRHYRGGGFGGVAFRAELRQKREADVDVVERIALDQTADADGEAALGKARQVQSEAEAPVAVHGALRNVLAGVGE